MKKAFNAILSGSIILSLSSLVISCRHAVYNPGLEGQRLLVITDAGSVSDHSFNEEIYHAILEYSERDNQENQWGFNFKNQGLSAKNNWVQPLRSDYENYVNSYKVAKYKGTDIYVLSGFQQDMSRIQASRIAGPNKTVIFVDSAKLSPEKNITHLSFNSYLYGFAAAYDSAVWATTINPETNKMEGQIYGDKSNIGFGTYAGISNKDATGSYLWGFLVGIGYFNARIIEENQPKRYIKLANFGVNGELNQLRDIEPTDARFFTGTFEPGAANRSGINDLLGPNGGKADVIFPIAGMQILDTLTANARAYMVGVDSNQALQFPEYQNRFITSATKDLKLALFDAFDHSKANRYNHYILENDNLGDLRYDEGTPAKGEFWDGTVPKPKNSWSHDLDQTIEEVGTKIPKTLVDFGDKNQAMAELMNEFFKLNGTKTKDFLSWSGEYGIEAIISQLISLDKLPVNFS